MATITPANVPEWARRAASPKQLSDAFGHLTADMDSHGLPMADFITLHPAIGEIGLSYESFQELEDVAEAYGMGTTRSKTSTGGYNFSASFHFMHEDKLFNVRMFYVTR